MFYPLVVNNIYPLNKLDNRSEGISIERHVPVLGTQKLISVRRSFGQILKTRSVMGQTTAHYLCLKYSHT